MKKRFLSLLLAMVLCVAILPQYALASEKHEDAVQTITLDDGDFIIVTTEVYETRATQTKSANRKYSYTTSSGDVEWVITLNGTFTYTGTTSTCTASSCTVTINDNSWYVVSKSASKSGSTATANVTMGRKVLGITITKNDYTLTLTCDKNGNLS